VDTIRLHNNIQEQLGLLVSEVISVEINIYRKKAFLKVISQEVANRAVTKCKGTLRYIEESLIHELQVEQVNEDVLPVHISNVPFEISNLQLSEIFSKYGTVIKVVSNKYSAEHIYHSAYTGKRTLYLQSVTRELPAFLDLFGQRVHIYFPNQQKKCFRCASVDHVLIECDQPPPPRKVGGFPVPAPSDSLFSAKLENPNFNFTSFPSSQHPRVRAASTSQVSPVTIRETIHATVGIRTQPLHAGDIGFVSGLVTQELQPDLQAIAGEDNPITESSDNQVSTIQGDFHETAVTIEDNFDTKVNSRQETGSVQESDGATEITYLGADDSKDSVTESGSLEDVASVGRCESNTDNRSVIDLEPVPHNIEKKTVKRGSSNSQTSQSKRFQSTKPKSGTKVKTSSSTEAKSRRSKRSASGT
jgi:hypothetical protein